LQKIFVIVTIIGIIFSSVILTAYNIYDRERENNRPSPNPTASETAPSTPIPNPTQQPPPTATATPPSVSPQSAESFVAITSPVNDEIVGTRQQITGVATNIPEGYQLWIAIRSGDLYYPQPKPWYFPNNGSWICDANFGNENDDNKKFEVIAVFANSDAQFNLTSSSEFPVFQFEGVIEKAKITVIRGVYSTEPAIPTPPTANSDEPSVTFTYPVNNADVDRNELVNGTSRNILVGQHLWIVVHVDGIYFAHEVPTINPDGTWEQNVIIGQADEGGWSFDLIAVLANNSEHESLQRWRTAQQDTESLYDLTNIPSDYGSITVTRRR
jgi:hypothetical protein